MIRRTVSAALLLRDGFTGRLIPSAASVLCTLDGRAVRPVRKTDGYLVLMDLEPGEHTLSLRCLRYRDEVLSLSIPAKGTLEMEVDLKPGPGYPFPADTVYLSLSAPEAGEEPVWAAAPWYFRLKLAQAAKADEGTELRLFWSGNPAQFPVPGTFLTVDEKNPELLRLVAIRGETGELSSPVQKAHARGTELRPARPFRTGPEGTVELVFPYGGEVLLFCRDQYRKAVLAPGKQVLSWAELK